MAAVPYNPPPSSRSSRTADPPRSSSRRPSVSLFDRVRSGLEAAEHLADDTERIAREVGKAARTAQTVEDDIEEAYRREGGGSARREKPRRAVRKDYDDATTDGESDEEARTGLMQRASKTTTKPDVVPYEPATSSRQRKKAPAPAGDSLDAFLADVDAAQEAVDNLSDDVERIASQRHRLTGLPYALHKLLSRRAHDPPRSRATEAKEAMQLAALIGCAKADLTRVYREVCALQPRMKALLAAPPSSTTEKRALKRAQKEYGTLTASYASLLDFVEDRAKEEKRAKGDGSAEGSLMDRMRDDHPEWERAKLVAQLQSAKKAAQATSLVKVDYSRDPYTARWLLQQPFTELDDVLQAIDLAENGITSRKDEKTGSWALGSLLSRAFSPPRKPRKPSSSRKPKPSKRSSRSIAEHEVGKQASSHRYHSEEKPSRHSAASDVSTDTDEWTPVQEKGLSKGEDSDDSYDASKLPERVPTDDTSGYVESREELIEDAKAQRRTEHFYTPLLVVYWHAQFRSPPPVLIALLYLYYLIARLLGFQSPLGNVDLGSHFGNSAWNDTADGLVQTRAASATPTTSTVALLTPEVLTGLPSATAIEDVLRSASAFEEVLASGAVSVVGGAITAMATVTAAP
ncbi:hypothetical protein JCM10450v2_000869 [Rhodotorula kratochvilovae]